MRGNTYTHTYHTTFNNTIRLVFHLISFFDISSLFFFGVLSFIWYRCVPKDAPFFLFIFAPTIIIYSYFRLFIYLFDSDKKKYKTFSLRTIQISIAQFTEHNRLENRYIKYAQFTVQTMKKKRREMALALPSSVQTMSKQFMCATI